MPEFRFDDFRIDTRRWRTEDGSVESHTLELLNGAGRPRNRAIVIFDSALAARAGGQVVGHASGTPQSGLSVTGWFALDAFAAWTAALGADGARVLRYALLDPGGAEGYVTDLALACEARGAPAPELAAAAR